MCLLLILVKLADLLLGDELLQIVYHLDERESSENVCWKEHVWIQEYSGIVLKSAVVSRDGQPVDSYLN